MIPSKTSFFFFISGGLHINSENPEGGHAPVPASTPADTAPVAATAPAPMEQNDDSVERSPPEDVPFKQKKI